MVGTRSPADGEDPGSEKRLRIDPENPAITPKTELNSLVGKISRKAILTYYLTDLNFDGIFRLTFEVAGTEKGQEKKIRPRHVFQVLQKGDCIYVANKILGVRQNGMTFFCYKQSGFLSHNSPTA